MKKCYKFELPLPPSINEAYIRTRNNRQIYSNKVRDYFGVAIILLQNQQQLQGFEIIDYYVYVDIYWTLRMRGSDTHNYKKVLFDALEKGGVVIDDKYILDRTQSISYNYKEPKVKIKICLKK